MGNNTLEIDSSPGLVSEISTHTAPNIDKNASSDATNNSQISQGKTDLQTALLAERREAALMRKALEERDRELNKLADQCQTLEDELEDRNRHIETSQLGNQGLYASDTPEQESRFAPSGLMADPSELFDAAAADNYEEKSKFQMPWKWLGGILGILILGFLGILAWPYISHYLKTLSLPKLAQNNTGQQPTTKISTPKIHTPNVSKLTNNNTQQSKIATPNTKTSPNIVKKPKPIPQPIRDRLRNGGQGPQMIKIPSGRFSMGNKQGFGSLGIQERPAHDVNIKTFYMARYETTFTEYSRFARATGAKLPNDSGFGRDNHPVINVNWNDAQAYVKWLSSETGKNYYLPSESQWEYAAKSGTTTEYWWGNHLKRGYAVCFGCGTAWDNRSTAPVGSIRPNAFGLYDTSGNVMEWVQDCHNKNYKGAPDNGQPWLSGNCKKRIIRGGTFNKPINFARNSARFHLPIRARSNMLGFRVARD